jgi:hypothetical protein
MATPLGLLRNGCYGDDTSVFYSTLYFSIQKNTLLLLQKARKARKTDVIGHLLIFTGPASNTWSVCRLDREAEKSLKAQNIPAQGKRHQEVPVALTAKQQKR